jgi:hypothetical protein
MRFMNEWRSRISLTRSRDVDRRLQARNDHLQKSRTDRGSRVDVAH